MSNEEFLSKIMCVACGSTNQVIDHHISYKPVIKIPLCRSCHYFAHHGTIIAGQYTPTFCEEESTENNALILHNCVVALFDGKGWRCLMCAFDGTEKVLENEQEFINHFIKMHNQVEIETRYPQLKRSVND